MTHHHQNNKSQHNHIWFSFTLGSIIGASGLFLIGTTQGRRLLKKAMEMAEKLEGSVEEMIVRLKEEEEDTGRKIISDPNLHTVLQKIQTALPHHKENKSLK